MYEYAILSEAVNVKPEVLVAATKKELLDNLGIALIRVMDIAQKSIKTFQGGGWEILSHQMTRLDHHLVVSFLIRRQK